jgi:hypothetical protein
MIRPSLLQFPITKLLRRGKKQRRENKSIDHSWYNQSHGCEHVNSGKIIGYVRNDQPGMELYKEEGWKRRRMRKGKEKKEEGGRDEREGERGGGGRERGEGKYFKTIPTLFSLLCLLGRTPPLSHPQVPTPVPKPSAFGYPLAQPGTRVPQTFYRFFYGTEALFSPEQCVHCVYYNVFPTEGVYLLPKTKSNEVVPQYLVAREGRGSGEDRK